MATIHASIARSSSQVNAAPNVGSCPIAVSFYKIVAERGCWKNNVLAEAEKYWNSPDPSLREGAILRWKIAADRGVETAQNNLAYILEEGDFNFVSLRIRDIDKNVFQSQRTRSTV